MKITSSVLLSNQRPFTVRYCMSKKNVSKCINLHVYAIYPRCIHENSVRLRQYQNQQRWSLSAVMPNFESVSKSVWTPTETNDFQNVFGTTFLMGVHSFAVTDLFTWLFWSWLFAILAKFESSFFCVNATIGMENANNFYAAQMNSHFISSLNSIYDVRTRNMQRSVEQTSCDKKEHRSHIAICMHYICWEVNGTMFILPPFFQSKSDYRHKNPIQWNERKFSHVSPSKWI